MFPGTAHTAVPRGSPRSGSQPWPASASPGGAAELQVAQAPPQGADSPGASSRQVRGGARSDAAAAGLGALPLRTTGLRVNLTLLAVTLKAPQSNASLSLGHSLHSLRQSLFLISPLPSHGTPPLQGSVPFLPVTLSPPHPGLRGSAHLLALPESLFAFLWAGASDPPLDAH